MNIRLILFTIVLWVGMLSSTGVMAQDGTTAGYSFDFRGEPLSDVLEQVARETGLDMIYDPLLVQGISIYRRIDNEPVEELLREVLKETTLDFITLSSGTIVIVKKVKDEPLYGSYTGLVVDSESGEPLPGASVMLADASGGTSTGRAGYFSLNRLLTGSHRFIFSYVGYEAVEKTVHIRPDRSNREKIALDPKPVDFIPIVVTGHRPRLPSDRFPSERTTPGTPWEPAGGMQDAIRSLNLFSGVQYGLPMAELHLQGGREGEHRIMLDGVPVYNPYSFGQMFSSFSPYAIGSVELHKAGFSVSRGSQIAGQIDLKHDLPERTSNRLMAQADPLSVNVRGDMTVSAGGDSTLRLMTALRTNYWDLYREPTLNSTLRAWDELDPLVTGFLMDADDDPSLYAPREHRSDVGFYDIHVASEYAIDDYQTLSSAFYLGENSVSTELLREAPAEKDIPRFLFGRDTYRWNNFMGRITLDQLVSPRLDLHTQVSYSSNRFNHRYLLGTSNNSVIPNTGENSSVALTEFQNASRNNLIPGQRSSNHISHLILRSDATYGFTPGFELEGGIRSDLVDSRVNLGDLFYLPTLTDQFSVIFGGYLNGIMTFDEYWTVSLGSRLTYHSTRKQLYPEPRASIQLDRPDSGIGYWTVRLSGGLYRQFVNQFEITNPGPTSLVPSFSVWSHESIAEIPKAWHLSGSFIWEPTQTTRVQLDGFSKWQPTTYIVSYRNLVNGTALNRSEFSAFGETTRSYSAGGGIRVKLTLAHSRIKLLAGYDYNYTRVDYQTQFGKTMPPPWNEPHRFQFRVLGKISPRLTSVVKWQGIWGRAWGFRQSYYDFLLENGVNAGKYTFTDPENDKLSPFYQLDLSLIYRPAWHLANAEIRLDLINLLDRENTIDRRLEPVQDTDRQFSTRNRTMPGFNPSLSIELSF